MSIDDDIAKYFWQPDPDKPTSAMNPALPLTTGGSFIKPCIDMVEYMERFQLALAKVGVDPDPANNAGDFIYIAGWWIGLAGGKTTLDKNYPDAPWYSSAAKAAKPKWHSSGTVLVEDEPGFSVNQDGKNLLIDVLTEKAKRGVDVRVLGWLSYSIYNPTIFPLPLLGEFTVNPYLMVKLQQTGVAGMVDVNAQTLNAAKTMRANPYLRNSAVLNILGHAGGAAHIKASLIGRRPNPSSPGIFSAIGFAGGLDLASNRWAKYGHGNAVEFWHDVQASIEGNALQGLYDHFLNMWNENLKREPYRYFFEKEADHHYRPGTTAVPKRAVTDPLLTPGSQLLHHVQSLRTIPMHNYKTFNCWPEGKPASFAPDGLFEIRAAWRSGILAAERFIYMEDQDYWSREVLEWLNESIRAHADLKVILLMRGGSDPGDTPSNNSLILHESFNLGLLGLDDPKRALSEEQRSRIRIMQRFAGHRITKDTLTVSDVVQHDADNATVTFVEPAVVAFPENKLQSRDTALTDPMLIHNWTVKGNPPLAAGAPMALRIDTSTSIAPAKGDILHLAHTFGLFIHTKTTIVDDRWALIGSANCMRRSLYTDLEYSVAFLDGAPVPSAVADYRARLWGEHFDPSGGMLIEDLDEALGVWEPTWNPDGDSPLIDPAYLRRIALPFKTPALTEEEIEKWHTYFDDLKDVDSRDPWGGICKPDGEPKSAATGGG